ncbi:MAG: hypothetical protein U9N12_04465 [Euryarchaeota archaeon]|nr:hypothetical protein [Euryarchaeota archaeon]
MEGLFTKNSAVRGRGLMLALMLALVAAAATPGVATAASVVEEVFIGTGVHHVVSRSVATQEVVIGGPSEIQDMSELNLTILRIDPRRHNMELMPGESHEFTVTVINPNNETVLVDPMIIEEHYSEYIFDEDWLTITPASAELEPDGGEEEFTIAVAIPDDADLGYYGVMLAFTEDAKPYPFPEPPYPSYVNTLNLHIEVWKPPVVQILPPRIRDRVEQGKGYDYAITLKNTVDHDINIDPAIVDVRRYGWHDAPPAFDDDAITIDAPASVPANGTATVSMHLEVPAGAKGRYNGEINLGIDDPSMGEWDEEGGTVRLRFTVWEQPTEPFLKAFATETDAPITILVESRKHKWSGTYETDGGDRGDCEPYFNLTLEGPDGTATLAPTRVTHHGTVSLSGISKYGYAPHPTGEMRLDEVYNEDYTSYTEEYLANGTIGNWELGILPHYVEEFKYAIAIGDAP